MADDRRRNRLPAIVAIVVASTCLGCLGIGGSILAIVSGRARGLGDSIARAKAAGLAVSLSDLKVSVERRNDAAPFVDIARKRLAAMPPAQRIRLDDLTNTVMSFRAEPAEKAEMHRALRWLRPVLEALRSAGERSRISVVEPETWFNTRFLPPNEVLSVGAALLSCEALLAGEDHDLPRAEAAINEGISILPLLGEERTFTAFRRRTWAEIRIQRACVRIVQENLKDPRAIRLLSRVQERLGPVPNSRDALGADLALVLDAIGRRKEDGIEQAPFADLFKTMGRAQIVDIFTKTVERLPRDPEDLDGADRAYREMEDEADEAPFYGGYARGYRSNLMLVKDMITRRRLAKEAEAVIASLAKGVVPTSIPDLGRDSIDPHNGKPLQMIRTPDRLVLYSVGRDTLDDKGRELPPTRLGLQTRDVVFAIPLGQARVPR